MSNKNRNFTFLRLGGSSLLIFLFLSCSQGTPVPPVMPNTVNIDMFAFNPSMMTVTAGTTVTWVNFDSVTHRVVNTSGEAFDSGNMGNGDSFSHTFTALGVTNYHCSIHPSMTGSITVTP
jgi:plastocyanin